MHYLVTTYGPANICEQILGFLDGGEYKRLTYHRAWTTPWSVQEDGLTSFGEIYNFPWKWYGGGHVMPDYPPNSLYMYLWKVKMNEFVTCSSYDRGNAVDHLCYWNRMTRLLHDTTSWGAILEIDLFDNAVLKYDTNYGVGTQLKYGYNLYIDQGGWKESPWNPSNQVDDLINDVNELDPIQSPRTDEPDDLGTQYTYEDTNYFYLTAPNTVESLPILKEQQRLLVEQIVNHTEDFGHVLYHIMNEPEYRHWHGPDECKKWHNMVAGWIATYHDSPDYEPKLGVNVFGYGTYTKESALQNLVQDLNSVTGIDVCAVSYHGAVWWHNSSTISSLMTWHRDTGNTTINPLVCIIDTDGEPSRDNNNNIDAWATLIYNNGEDFNHKDYLWRYMDYNQTPPVVVNLFAIDSIAMKKIYDPGIY